MEVTTDLRRIRLYRVSGCGAAGSAGGLGPSGRRFEPCHSDHVNEPRFSNIFIEKRGFFYLQICILRCFSKTHKLTQFQKNVKFGNEIFIRHHFLDTGFLIYPVSYLFHRVPQIELVTYTPVFCVVGFRYKIVCIAPRFFGNPLPRNNLGDRPLLF